MIAFPNKNPLLRFRPRTAEVEVYMRKRDDSIDAGLTGLRLERKRASKKMYRPKRNTLVQYLDSLEPCR